MTTATQLRTNDTRWDFYHKPESNKTPVAEIATKLFVMELPTGLTLAEGLALAYEKGLPKGSRRCGCVEIQNDLGIFSMVKGNRIDPTKESAIVFTDWGCDDDEFDV